MTAKLSRMPISREICATAGLSPEYKELAELGLPQAQFDLAVMYYRGEGVASSNVSAHAWAALAGQNGEVQGRDLAGQLEPQLTPTSMGISAEIQSKYNQASLDARLLPRMLKDKEYADRDPVRPSKPFIPGYPADAEHRGIQGEVYVEFIVATCRLGSMANPCRPS